ncbi:MAG: hypothetical protein HY319_20490 [Armatimonadetes bacterium]|nr:hypothetical protein [Armatimonadota bacterium]
MRSRRWTELAILLTVIAVAAWLLLPAGAPAVDSIELGMTRAEVEETIREPFTVAEEGGYTYCRSLETSVRLRDGRVDQVDGTTLDYRGGRLTGAATTEEQLLAILGPPDQVRRLRTAASPHQRPVEESLYQYRHLRLLAWLDRHRSQARFRLFSL